MNNYTATFRITLFVILFSTLSYSAVSQTYDHLHFWEVDGSPRYPEMRLDSIITYRKNFVDTSDVQWNLRNELDYRYEQCRVKSYKIQPSTESGVRDIEIKNNIWKYEAGSEYGFSSLSYEYDDLKRLIAKIDTTDTEFTALASRRTARKWNYRYNAFDKLEKQSFYDYDYETTLPAKVRDEIECYLYSNDQNLERIDYILGLPEMDNSGDAIGNKIASYDTIGYGIPFFENDELVLIDRYQLPGDTLIDQYKFDYDSSGRKIKDGSWSHQDEFVYTLDGQIKEQHSFVITETNKELVSSIYRFYNEKKLLYKEITVDHAWDFTHKQEYIFNIDFENDKDRDCVEDDVDCNPDDPNIPGDAEIPYNLLDDDCDPSTPDDDLDGDGYGIDEDCDDSNIEIHPDATDIPDNGIDENCDGIDEMILAVADLDQEVYKILPNPAFERVYIDTDQVNFSVSIYRNTGQRISNFENQKIIDVSELKPGIYFFKILDKRTNESTVHKQVIINN